MKKTLLLLLTFISISVNAQTLLTDNGDFESSTLAINQTYSYRKGLNTNSTNCGNLTANWGTSFSYGLSFPGPSTSIPIDDLNSQVSLVTQGFDETLIQHGIQLKKVSSGNRAMRLNQKDNDPGAITSLRKKYTNTKKFISFDFSLVGEVHSSTSFISKEGFFSVRLINNNNVIVAQKCYIANTTIPFYSFYNGNSGYYVNWKKFDMEVPANYIGKNLTLEIITSGCAENGHFQVLYLDNIKNTDDSQSTPCEVKIDNIKLNTTTNKYEVCGTFTEPSSGLLTSLNIFIYKNGSPLSTFTLPPSISGNQFCFEIPSSYITFPGNYSFQVAGNFKNYFNQQQTITLCADFADLPPPFVCDLTINYNHECYDNYADICGTYTIPSNAILYDSYLNIYKNNVLIQTNINNLGSTLGQYCFKQYVGSLEHGQQYTYEVVVEYYLPDNTFKQCKISHNINNYQPGFIDPFNFSYTTNNGVISWPSFANTYTHEIVYDEGCLGDNNFISLFGPTYQFTTPTNSISLTNLQQIASQNLGVYGVVRWRMYLGCGKWSDWCCISLDNYPKYPKCLPDLINGPLVAYPNPTSNITTIQNKNFSYYEVFSSKGEKVLSKQINKNFKDIQVDLTNQRPDIYIIKFDSKESIKVIKQ